MVIIIFWMIFFLAVMLLLFYKFIFLRDPERKIPSGKNIVAPADGEIININALCSDVVKEGYLVSIFMNVFNVHVNRAPVDGRVLSVKHKKGRFFMAFDIEKSFLNESNEIIMETKIGKIKIIQIAGFVARRIECFVKEKQKINKGERIGRIIMGSQVSLILPENVKLLVKAGDKVKAGVTILGEYHK